MNIENTNYERFKQFLLSKQQSNEINQYGGATVGELCDLIYQKHPIFISDGHWGGKICISGVEPIFKA
jgi:hypothetical protein